MSALRMQARAHLLFTMLCASCGSNGGTTPPPEQPPPPKPSVVEQCQVMTSAWLDRRRRCEGGTAADRAWEVERYQSSCLAYQAAVDSGEIALDDERVAACAAGIRELACNPDRYQPEICDFPLVGRQGLDASCH